MCAQPTGRPIQYRQLRTSAVHGLLVLSVSRTSFACSSARAALSAGLRPHHHRRRRSQPNACFSQGLSHTISSLWRAPEGCGARLRIAPLAAARATPVSEGAGAARCGRGRGRSKGVSGVAGDGGSVSSRRASGGGRRGARGKRGARLWAALEVRGRVWCALCGGDDDVAGGMRRGCHVGRADPWVAKWDSMATRSMALTG